MASVVFVQPDGEKRELSGIAGQSLMQLARANLVPGIVGECGGELSCATCHVFVDEGWFDRLQKPTSDEIDMLEVAAAEPTDSSRLCCQIEFNDSLDGIIVHIPTEQ
ncbi:2Fe-2S iron-sulfur cluster-binding protein [Rhodococcoides fascians]|uniref:2Fe-2S iron-sulfur cluster-binding protein n=1 Tax=Rhodococcoides fascians TaxID=1828 RepID=UPI00056B938C|nr:2Fe-2S iron-sulfur cluster-binding protein [Rhodococcus fascians]